MERLKRTIKSPTKPGRLNPEDVASVVRAVHVAPGDESAWTVRAPGPSDQRPRFDSKAAALEFARRLGTRRGAEVIVHGRNGRSVRRLAPEPRP